MSGRHAVAALQNESSSASRSVNTDGRPWNTKIASSSERYTSCCARPSRLGSNGGTVAQERFRLGLAARFQRDDDRRLLERARVSGERTEPLGELGDDARLRHPGDLQYLPSSKLEEQCGAPLQPLPDRSSQPAPAHVCVGKLLALRTFAVAALEV